jgi:hypothetical protein
VENMAVLRLDDALYEKVKNRAKEQNKKITDLSNEIVKFYFYHKENELDHTLEKYMYEQFQKMDKHLSSIMIKSAKDTCTNIMGTVQALKLITNGKMKDEEIRKELERLGIIYFNESWRKKGEG